MKTNEDAVVKYFCSIPTLPTEIKEFGKLISITNSFESFEFTEDSDENIIMSE